MASSNGQYVSVFKINGKPILPPVIDENRRTELNRDRMLAIEIERRLHLKRAQQIIPEESVMGNVSTRDNLDVTLKKNVGDCNASNYDTSAAIDSLLDDHSHTLRDETITNIDQHIEDGVNVHSSSDESHASDVHINTKASNIASLTLAIDTSLNSTTSKMLSPSFSLHSSPSVGALDESRNLSLYFTPMSGRESLSPISFQKSQITSPRLIRSNSYTLDKPSPMLLKHLENNGLNPNVNDSTIKSPMAMSRFRNTQNITSTCIPRKSATENSKEHKSRSTTVKTSIGATKQTVSMSTTNTSVTLNKVESANNGLTKSNSFKSTKVSNKSARSSNSSFVFKNNESILRSIYGQKLVAKVQHSNKKNKSSTASIESANKSTVESSQAHNINSISLSPSNNTTNNNNNNTLSTHDYHQILAMFEQQQAALLKRQEEEQKRMQEEFLRQREELLQKMKILIANKSNAQITPNGSGSLDESSMAELSKKSNEEMLIDEVNKELPVIVDSNGNRVNRFKPESGKCIRRLNYNDDNNLNLNNNHNNVNNNNHLSLTKLSTDESEQFEMHTIEEVQAASIIVAYAKGYLTRRLLKTKKVMELQKMHHDTFELLMDISEEDNKNESKSDVEFKFSLLQQLASASAELKEIFFKIPMVERMDIIARDRIIKEKQQLRLNRSKSVDNAKTNKKHMVVNGNSLMVKHAKR